MWMLIVGLFVRDNETFVLQSCVASTMNQKYPDTKTQVWNRPKSKISIKPTSGRT